MLLFYNISVQDHNLYTTCKTYNITKITLKHLKYIYSLKKYLFKTFWFSAASPIMTLASLGSFPTEIFIEL